MKDLSEVSYYQGIYDDHIVLGNGDVVIGFNLFFPEVWSGDKKYFDEVNETLISLIRRLPDNAMAHFQTCVFNEKHQSNLREARNGIELEDLISWDKREVVQLYQRVFITLSNEVVNKISEMDNPLMRASQYIIKRPFKLVQQLLENFDKSILTITNILEQNRYISSTRMAKNELYESVYEYQNQCYDKTPSRNKNFVNGDIMFENGTLKIGNEYVAVVTLRKEGELLHAHKENHVPPNEFTKTDLPEHVKLPVSMGFSWTVAIPFPHIYNVGIEKVNNEQAIGELKKQKRGVKPLTMVGVGKAIRQRDEIGGQKDHTGEIVSNGIIDQVENENLQMTRTRVNIIVKDSSAEVLRKKVEYVINAFADVNESAAQAENAHTLNLFFASAPGCMRFNYRSLWQVSYQSVHYVLKESLFQTDREGLRFVDRTGKPITINAWKNQHLVARNAVLFAPTGEGKSVLLNHLVNQYKLSDYWVIIIDVGGSFKRNTIINEGFYFDAGVADNLQFNIFLCDQDKEGNYIYAPDDETEDEIENEDEPKRKDDQVNFVASILLKIWKGNEKVSKEEKAALKKTIVAFYEWVNKHKQFPDLKLYHAFLGKLEGQDSLKWLKFIKIDGLQLVLDEFVSGQYKKLLNSKRNVQLQNQKMLVFDLEAIKDNEDINEIVIAIVMHYSSEIILKKKGRKAYIIDEAIDYLKGDMGDFIAGQYRKIRKKEGQAIISTQGIGYLDELNVLTKRSILGNSSIVMLLSHANDKASYPLLKQDLSLTDGEMEQLKSLGRGAGYREVLWKMGSTFCQVLRVQVSKFAITAYNTDPDDVKEIEEHYKKSKNHIVAIRDYLETKTNHEKELV